MSRRLHNLLPELKWKRLKIITPSEAARLTDGNTDKFTNKDYWVTSPLENLVIPIGALAVYYKDNQWLIVEKVLY